STVMLGVGSGVGTGPCGERKVTGPLLPSGTGWGALGNRVVCTASGGGGSVTVTSGVGSGVGMGPCGERKVTGPLLPSGMGSRFVTGSTSKSTDAGASGACGETNGGVGSGVGTGPCGERKVTAPLLPSGIGSRLV